MSTGEVSVLRIRLKEKCWEKKKVSRIERHSLVLQCCSDFQRPPTFCLAFKMCVGGWMLYVFIIDHENAFSSQFSI